MLFDPWVCRGVRARNRVVVSPMCQYLAEDGAATDWHLVHLGSRAVGGAGIVCTEATAVTAEGRISPTDLGLWDDRHIAPLARITRFLAAQGAVPAIQLAHAGRKASTAPPWQGGARLAAADGGWEPVAPSAVPFVATDPAPRALTLADIRAVVAAFVQSARRALAAGFQIIELHAAHGYLLHEFLSPLSNRRDDAYGGAFAHRCRLVEEVASAVRAALPPAIPLWVRLSCTDWVDGGWGIEDSVALARRLLACGVDVIDCSSGGAVSHAHIPVAPSYQVPFSARIRAEAGIATAAVGMITGVEQAEGILRAGQADLILMAREFLRDPYWPLHHAVAAGAQPPVPVAYGRAFR